VTFFFVAFLEQNLAKDIYNYDYSRHPYQITSFHLRANAEFVCQE